MLGSLWDEDETFVRQNAIADEGPISWAIILSAKLSPFLKPTGAPSILFHVSGQDPCFKSIESSLTMSLSQFRELVRKSEEELETVGTRSLDPAFLQAYGSIEDFANGMSDGNNRWGFEPADKTTFNAAIVEAVEPNVAAVKEFQENLLFAVHLTMGMAARASEVVCLSGQSQHGKRQSTLSRLTFFFPS